MERRKVYITISIEIETTKQSNDIKAALTRGIYKGLDTEPNYIAQPQDVIINSIDISN